MRSSEFQRKGQHGKSKWQAVLFLCFLIQVAATAKAEIIPLTMTMDKSWYDTIIGYTIYQCSASLSSKITPECTINSTSWQVYFDEKKGSWKWVDFKTYLSYYGYTASKSKTEADYSVSNKSLVFSHKPVNKGLIPCPALQADVSYTCPAPKDPCACPSGEKRQLGVQDSDGDFYTRYQGAMCPSDSTTEWIVTSPDKVKGFECGYKWKSTVTECGVTYNSWQKDYSFPDAYVGAALSDPNWNPESQWVLDNDVDGFFDLYAQSFKGCSPPDFTKYKLKTDKIKSDCDDKDAKVTTATKYCIDKDGDGFCCADLNNDDHCDDPPNYGVIKTLCPAQYNSQGYKADGYVPIDTTKSQPDECDTVKDILSKFEVCEDKDKDGFVDKSTCKSTCTADAYPGLIKADSKKPNKGYDCTNGDNNAPWNPNTQWLIDCDGDGYYSEDKVVKGCQKPKSPEICIYDANKQKAENPTANPLTEYVTSYSDAGKTLKKGDCADQWFKMHAGTTWGVDVDGDDYYDVTRSIVQCEDPDKVANQNYPQCSGSADPDCSAKAAKYSYKNLLNVDWKKGDCDDDDAEIKEFMYVFADQDNDKMGDPLYSEIINCENKPLVSDANENFDWASELDPQIAWVKRPNDIQIGDKAAPAFFIEGSKTPYCINQASPQTNNCLVYGDFCRYEPNLYGPDFSCLASGLRNSYCKTIGSIINPNEAYDFTPWYNDGKFPYGTAYPILKYEDYEALGIKKLDINWLDPWLLASCLYHNAGGPSTFFLGWLNVAGKNDPYMFLELQPKFDDAEDIAPPSWYRLVAAYGTDYELKWPTLAQPEYAALWKAPQLGQIPSATIEPEQFSAYFWVLDLLKVNTLDGLKKLTANLEYQPYPLPVKVTQTGSAWGVIANQKRCVYYGQLLTEDQCLGKGHGKKDLNEVVEKPYLLPKYANDTTDSNKNGIPDVIELSLPNLTAGEVVSIQNGTLVPGYLGKNHIAAAVVLPQEDDMFKYFKNGQAKAIEMLAEKMSFISAITDKLVTGFELKNAQDMIEKAKWVKMWELSDGTISWEPPVMNIAGQLYVNPWFVQQESQGGDPNLALANAILHGVLHSYVQYDTLHSEHQFLAAVLGINIDHVNDVE